MAEQRQREQWARTSSIMALIANTQRHAKHQRAFRPSDFDPFARKRETMKADVSVLRDVFIDGRVPGLSTTASQRVAASEDETCSE